MNSLGALNFRRVLNLLVMGIVFTVSTGFGDKVYFLNEEGNKAYQEEKYQEALKKYREAQLEDPESKSILYNIGNVFYRQGNHEKALEKYNLVLHKDPSEMETDSLFNRGNTLFRAAESDLRTGKLDLAKENLITAIHSYREVLLLNPDDRESKYNLELALRRLNDLEKKQSEQEQKKNQNQDRKQSQQQQDQSGEQKNRPEDPQSPELQPNESDQRENRETKGKPENEKQSPADQFEGTPPEMRKMTKEEAETILQALKNDERKVQEILRKPEFTGQSVEKDW